MVDSNQVFNFKFKLGGDEEKTSGGITENMMLRFPKRIIPY